MSTTNVFIYTLILPLFIFQEPQIIGSYLSSYLEGTTQKFKKTIKYLNK